MSGIMGNKLGYRLTMMAVSMFKWLEMMMIKTFRSRFERLTFKAYRKGGVILNGKNPWDIQVKNKEFYARACNQGSLGIGESYVEGMWDAEDVVELTSKVMKNGIYKIYMNPLNRFLNFLECYFFNLQTKTQAWEVGQKHYDLGNDLFENFLDPSMNYSCGYWKNASNLTDAQIDKMDLIAKKLSLKPGMRVLDIGCGWGGLCHHLAKNYGVSVVGITISKEGARAAQDRCTGLPVDIRLMDYRDLQEQFDRIVSVGMFEHVGHNNYREFFETTHRCLKEDGIFLLHTIGVNHHDVPCAEPWFHYYIFPNGILPYYKHITDCTEKLFVIEDWQNMGNDYSKTLLAWLENFKKNWPTLESKYGEKFYRLWTYYLQFSAGAFRSRKFQLWQVVLSKNGIEGGYYAAR